MRFYAITVLLIAAVTAAAASLGYLCLRTQGAAPIETDTLTWLRTEFDLSPEQLARIEASHAAYSLVCAEHCESILKQRATVATLQAQQAAPEQIQAAMEEARQIDAHCTASVEAHVREIAALIGGEQGERYLQKVLPRLAHFDHATAPDLMLNSTAADASPACH